MPYDTSRLLSISFPVSEAIGDTVHTFKAPSSGQVYDINLSTTTTWAGATNQLIVEVGTSADHDLYAELRSGTAANGTGGSSRYSMTADTTSLYHTTNSFDAGDSVGIWVTAPAGAGEAGVGVCTVTFALAN